MDPDQVAAAGAHGNCSCGGESWPCALLRCGWRLSRMAAIVGAAATVAQVVAPPIVLLSAAGLALSVPFTAYLAVLAATDRLMSALLPSFPAEPVHLHGGGDDGARQEFFDASQKPGQEEVRVFHCCRKTEEDALPPLPDLPALMDEDDILVQTVSFQESGQEPFVSNNRDKIEDGTTMEEDAVAVQQSGQDSLASNKRDEISETPAAKFTEEDIVATTNVEAVETACGGELQAETSYQVAVCSSVSVASPLIVNEDEDGMPSRSTPDIPAICDETSQPDRATGLEYPSMVEGFGGNAVSGDKHLYTEAQLREQLETVRTITGYRSPPSSTLAGELAGLYLFVGVEPQVMSSTDDASDLTEINAKLRILKSIIGVD
ncbi:hypothetical protein ABZP36_008584 [Zizania latifolia]